MEHAFSYRVFMACIDLDELPAVFDIHPLWSARRAAPARFRREDHFGPAGTPLAVCVRDLVERETGRRPTGSISLLTHLRYLGHCFNPVSFYYCFADDGETLDAVVAEVSNTPWGERHCYVLDAASSQAPGGGHRFRHEKQFAVSPFLPMDMEYDWRVGAPGRTLAVHISNLRNGEVVFDATLALRRTPMSRNALTRVLLRYPPMTIKVVAGIYWNALRLWLKGVPFLGHPTPTAKMGTTRHD